MRRLGFGLGVLLGFAAACGLGVEGSTPEDNGTVDAGPNPSPTSTSPTVQHDASVPAVDGSPSVPEDAAPDASTPCQTVIDDGFAAALDPNWERLGTDVRADAGVLSMTRGEDYGQLAAIWWKAPITFDAKLEIDVAYGWRQNSKQGEGIAVAWIDADTPYELGGLSNGMALCNNTGMRGSAAALDTRDTLLSVLSPISPECPYSPQYVSNGSIPATGTLHVEVTATTMTATLGTRVVTRPVTNAKRGFFGVTSSTSAGASQSANSDHWLTHVTVKACR